MSSRIDVGFSKYSGMRSSPLLCFFKNSLQYSVEITKTTERGGGGGESVVTVLKQY
jgi:hypothetical protein